MDINTSNNINSISNVQNNALERIATGLAVNSASDDSSSLSIATNLEAQRSTLNQTLGNLNSGIAMSNIAQGGLQEQKNILEEINTLTLQAMNGTTSMEGRESIKEQISKYIDQFENIAESTTYSGTQLLSGEQKDLSVVTDADDLINMQSQNTVALAEKMRSYLDDFTLDTESMNNLYNANNLAMSSVSEFTTSFSSASNAMESSGRNSLAAQTSIVEASSTLVDVDYGKAVTDFSASNLMAQIGLLASTQANAVQQRSVALLS